MPQFSTQSKSRLSTCHPDLQRLFNEVVKTYGCTIICGHRSEVEQKRLVMIGASQVKVSKHNHSPSLAIDAAPWFAEKPHIKWEDTRAFDHFAGYVCGVASQLGIKIRWGGDWNGNKDLRDQNFNDLPHFELLP